MTCMKNYTGDGISKAFPVPFAIPADYALEVLVNGAAPEQGFHILGAGSADGAVVVFDGAPAMGEAISLRYLGGVTIGIEDAAAGHLTDKLVAGAGIALNVETGTTGIQQLRVAATEPADMLKKSENLADLPDKALARENLGVYSTSQTDQAISTAVGSLSADVLHASLNLGDVANVAAARANLGVYSTAQTDAAVAALSGQVLHSAQNLADVASVAAARTNLDVYSKGESSGMFLAKAQNLADLGSPATARHNLGLDQVAYLNAAQDWTQPQRSQALQTASVGASVTLDFGQYQNFDLTLTANVIFADPALTAAQVGQKGTISITPGSSKIAAMGSYWKRVGDVGWPSTITGMGRIDYHIRSTTRIEYAYNDVEA